MNVSYRTITPAKSGLKGKLSVPGDKSVSHRAAMLLAVANGTGRIGNFGTGDDCAATLRCLSQLGVRFQKNDNELTIEGLGFRALREPREPMDCGNSGTTLRLLTGLLSGSKRDLVLTGDSSLRSRPMERIIEPLNVSGANIGSDRGRAPLRISKTGIIAAGKHKLRVKSAQVKSALLLSGLTADGVTEVIEQSAPEKIPPTRDHTERMLAFLGADIERDYIDVEAGFCHRIRLAGPANLGARTIDVPGDISGAAFFLVAASSVEGSEISLTGVGLNPTRNAIIDLLKDCGARIEALNEIDLSNEPRGDIRVMTVDAPAEERVVISGSRTAALIDEIPVIAVLGTRMPGGLEVRDGAELRVKECDRIAAIVRNLQAMGAEIEEFEDGFIVQRSELKGGRVESDGDHRIAMAFAVAALIAEGPTTIGDSDCVSISYPGFFEDLEGLKRLG